MRVFLAAAAALLICTGCARGPAPVPQAEKRVLVSITPQAFFAERIAGGRFGVETLVEPGQSPHSFEPTPKKVAAMSGCSAWFLSGMPFENALIEKSGTVISVLKKFDTRMGIDLLDAAETGGICEEGHDGCDHGDHGAEGLKDPHFWLDPVRAAKLAENIRDGLCEIDPDGRETYGRNTEALKSELSAAAERIAQRLAPFKGAEVFVFHPAFGYFTSRFGLSQASVESEGKEPGARALAELIDRAKNRGVKIVFVQPQFPSGSANAVAAAIGGRVVPMDPLARDYFGNLESMSEAIASALGAGAASRSSD